MSKNKEYQLVVGINWNVETASFLIFYGNNIEDSDKQSKVSNTKNEARITSIKRYFFHQRMIHFEWIK